MGSNEKNRDPFEKLNLKVWASTLQSIASQTRRRARTRPLVGSPSKKQTRVRDMLQSFGNLFLVRLVIYYELERV